MIFHLLCALGLLGCYLALARTAKKLNARLESPERKGMNRVLKAAMILIVVLLIGGGWLLAIGESQLKPHVITTSINGKVLSTFTATNPAYLTWETRPVWTTNGREYRSFPVTHYYWHIWNCFQP